MVLVWKGVPSWCALCHVDSATGSPKCARQELVYGILNQPLGRMKSLTPSLVRVSVGHLRWNLSATQQSDSRSRHEMLLVDVSKDRGDASQAKTCHLHHEFARLVIE